MFELRRFKAYCNAAAPHFSRSLFRLTDTSQLYLSRVVTLTDTIDCIPRITCLISFIACQVGLAFIYLKILITIRGANGTLAFFYSALLDSLAILGGNSQYIRTQAPGKPG